MYVSVCVCVSVVKLYWTQVFYSKYYSISSHRLGPAANLSWEELYALMCNDAIAANNNAIAAQVQAQAHALVAQQQQQHGHAQKAEVEEDPEEVSI